MPISLTKLCSSADPFPLPPPPPPPPSHVNMALTTPLSPAKVADIRKKIAVPG